MAELNILEAFGARWMRSWLPTAGHGLGEDVGRKGGVFGATTACGPSTATSAFSTPL